MEILEFLNYVEDSTDAVASNAKSELVKHIHERVNKEVNFFYFIKKFS